MTRPPPTDGECEVREPNAAEFVLMRPLSETDPGPVDAMQTVRKKGGRPKLESPKVHVGFRMSAEVFEGIRIPAKATMPASKGFCGMLSPMACSTRRPRLKPNCGRIPRRTAHNLPLNSVRDTSPGAIPK